MIHYILQTIAFQLVFLLAYDVFLKKETFFKWNRLYLLATAFLSLILPFIKIQRFKEVVPQNYIMSLPEVILGQSLVNPNDTIILNAVVLEQNSMSFWEVTFYIGLCVAFCLFLYKVFKIFVLVIKNPKQSIGNIVLVELLNSNAAFSFFHYIFLGERIKAEDKEAILKHELIHTQQKHTLDLLFFEVLRIVFWFNPFVYMYQNRMATLHEFIADANAVKHQNKNEYYQNLLAQVFETKNISFINTFFKQSLIKKRIVMLSKAKSKQIHLIKYALLIPLVFGMLIYTSAEAQEAQTENQKDVIDLSQYKHTLVGTKNTPKDMKVIHDEYRAFLNDNPNYFGMMTETLDQKGMIYSIHHRREKIPKGYKEIQSSPYKMFVKLIKSDFEKTKEAELIPLNETSLEVPFAVIDQVPIFPGCEDLLREEQKKCISENIAKHVNRNFNTDLANKLGLAGRQRINVIFKINEEGNVIGIRSRAAHPDLEAEAIRVIKTLPKMIPGEHNGKNVTVPYSLPIIFQVQDQSVVDETVIVAYGEKKDKNTSEEDVEVPFAVIENVPVYPGCEDLVTNAEKKACMSEKLSKFVIENFNTKLANNLGLSGRQRINVIFKISKEGYITGIRSRAPHPALETEAVRVISSLPKMKPGVQKGKAVTVPYSLPIIFEVADDNQMLEEVAIVGYADDTLGGATPFAIVDKAPILTECESLESEKEKKNCTTNGISKYVAKNFNTSLAKSLGLKGRQRINIVFKITKKGKIVIEKSRAPHPSLEDEAIRVIKSIPKLIPGEHKGKKVDVLYSLPIIFQVHD
ncbi:energy transducer TonB [Wocania ichthyoenteri]|uniref:energy transducer TonB n=1 Tax=Wocania ichthyoenteri TaxID=1230531 RepID=UPI0009DF03DE|nr:energy transducer TonB [Wocania ichthyoenteri]